jgi:pimeloyl-ACP methyl ester carboxylesterase
MTTAAESTSKTLDVAGIGPVELTVEHWGDGQPPDYGQAYASAIHRARFEMLPATGHMPQMETPDLVLRAIL